MEELFAELAGYCALIVEAFAVVVIVYGAARAMVSVAALLGEGPGTLAARRSVWLHFARWLLLGLEFALAADIIRTAVAPTWTDLGQLATIAAIRTGLGYFLERDMREIQDIPVPVDGVREMPLEGPRRQRTR